VDLTNFLAGGVFSTFTGTEKLLMHKKVIIRRSFIKVGFED
jgi:hypothetical protein